MTPELVIQKWPKESRYLLKNILVPDCFLNQSFNSKLVKIDLLIQDTQILSVALSSETKSFGEISTLDLDGYQCWSGYADIHTHLDKTHTNTRTQNTDGTFAGAIEAEHRDQSEYWCESDIRTRMEFALNCAFTHGTTALRTHLVSNSAWRDISWGIFNELKGEWASRIQLQATSLVLIDELVHNGDQLADFVASNQGVLGCVVLENDTHLEEKIDTVFRLANKRDLDIDFHADENGNPNSNSAHIIAKTALKHRFEGQVVIGHACSLSTQSSGQQLATLALLAEANIGIISMPQTNSLLQDRRSSATPQWRGLTLLHELKNHGIPTSIASDNCQDYWNYLGDYDLHEIFTQALLLGQLDLDIPAWISSVTSTPRSLMRLEHTNLIANGQLADFNLFHAGSLNELFARPQHNRLLVRRGKLEKTSLASFI